MRKTAKFIFKLLNNLLYRVEYINRDKLPLEGPAIIVSNHQHVFDIPLIHCATKPWVYWVAKKELIEKPVLGYFIKKMGALSVDREKSDLSVAKAMFVKIKERKVLGIFPEGTRVKSEDEKSNIIPKTGAVHFAIKTKTPVIPVCITGKYKLFAKIKVIVGDPLDFDEIPDDISGKTEIMKKSVYMMKEIYKLGGIDYYTNDSLEDKDI